MLELPPRSGELVDEPSVRQGDRGLRRECLEERFVAIAERCRPRRPDRDRTDRPAVGEKRRGQDGANALEHDVVVGPRAVVKAIVGQIVVGSEGCAARRRHSRDTLVEGLVGRRRPFLFARLVVAGRVDAAQEPGLRYEVDPGAVGVEEAHGLVDRQLDDVLPVAQGRDLGSDLAHRPLGVGPPGDLGP